MKLVLLILLYLTFHVNTSWSIDPAIVRSISDINKQKLIELNYSCIDQLLIPFNPNLKNTNPDYNDCMTQLCGGPSAHPSAWVNDLNFSNNISNSLRDEVNKLDPIMTKIFNKNRKKSLNELEKLDHTLKNSQVGDLDPNKFSSTFREDVDSIIFKKNIEEIFDKSKPLENRVILQLKIPANASEDYKKAASEFAQSYKKFLYDDYSSATANLIYTPSELYEVAKAKLKKAQDLLEKNKDQFNKYQYSFIEGELEKAKNSLTIDNPVDFKSENFFPVIEAAFSNYTVKELASQLNPEKPRCMSINCQRTYYEYFKKQNVHDNILKLRSTLNDPKTEAQYINRCKANILASTMASTDHEKSWALFDRAMKDVIANVLPRFSEHSRKILFKYLKDELIFSHKKIRVSKDRNTFIKEFKTNAQNYLDQVEVESSSNNSFSNFENSTESALRKSIMMDSNFSGIDPLEDIFSPCYMESIATAWDSFLPVKLSKQILGSKNELTKSLPNKDHVFISDFSCTHDHIGKQNVAHEIGHALNHVFAHTPLSGESLAKYKSLRSCVTDNYINPQLNKTMLSQPDDSIYSEEDTADLFAIITYTTDKNLFSCSLLKPSNDLKSYSDLAFILEEGDSHSTAFTRVIMEAINKNIELPVSCQRAISKDSPSLRFKKCL